MGVCVDSAKSVTSDGARQDDAPGRPARIRPSRPAADAGGPAGPLRRFDLGRLRTVALCRGRGGSALFFQSQNSAFMSSDNLLSLLRAMSSLAIIASHR